MFRWIVFLVLILFVSACDSNQDQRPTKVVWGRDVGVKSGMVLSDPRYGVQLVEPDGRSKLFVEIGTAVQWLKEHPESKAVRIWVSDYDTQDWVEANKANWTSGAKESPMGFGFRAFKSSVPNAIEFEKVKESILSGKNQVQENKKRYQRKKS